ncbi:MAG: penicillin-binding transpeptidase domain-containing protein [Syntrophothermus sp.]
MIFLVAVAFIFLLAVRMIYLQVWQNAALTAHALQQRMRPVPVDARRGTIYDRNGQKLAISLSADAVYVIPPEVKNPQETAGRLAKILKLDYAEVYRRVTSRSASEWIKKRVPLDQAKEIRRLDLPGVGIVENPQRFYPNGSLAAHLLGFAGIDNQGLEGLEYQYDRNLRGVGGRVLAEQDAGGQEIPDGIRRYIPAENGDDLVLTIDKVIQYVAERELKKAVRASGAKKGTFIIMNPRTGEILAMAVFPEFDPNDYARYPAANRRNIALTDIYEPGSTFKAITAAAAIEENLVNSESPERVFNDPGYVLVPGGRVNCWKEGGHGRQSFVEAVENSCNPVFATLGIELGGQRFYDYVRAFGFGSQTGIDFPGETGGRIRPVNTLRQIDLANIGFGQGLGVTPLQLLTAISAIANDGRLVKPYLVKEIRGADGRLIKENQPTEIRQVLSFKTAREMRRILRSVVVNGSGKRADIEGYRVAGKTGTAQVPEAGRYSDSKVVSSFVGFTPAEDPVIAGLVALYEPTSQETFGGVIAAPVFRTVVADVLNYLKVPPKYEPPPEPGRGPAGEIMVIVPNVRYFLALDEAKKILQKAGLKFAVTGAGEVVVDQIPKPGAKVPQGTTILLHLSRKGQLVGEEAVFQQESARPTDTRLEVKIPDLEGLTMRQAAEALERVGLRFRPMGSGLAVNQNPAAGSRVRGGTLVTVEFQPPSG